MNRSIITNVNTYSNRDNMTSSTEVNKVTFELPCAFTWGVKKGKHMGYSIPITLDEETIAKVNELAEENDAKNPLYGYGESKTLYLASNNLSPKQKKELLGKGKSHVLINFVFKGVNTSKDINYLSFKITKLRKVEYDNDAFPED